MDVNSIEEFISEVFKILAKVDAYNNDQSRHNHKGIAFRGQANKHYELIPAIGRGREDDYPIFKQERNLIEMAKFKLPHIFRSDLLPIDLLALLQHYGIPTRLLDVTSNPLVALYFATENDDEDGEVFAFDYNDSDRTIYPMINAIAESYKFVFTTSMQLSLFYERIIAQPYFIEQKALLSGFKNNCDGGKWVKECCNELMFVNASEQIERQKLQQGFYILFPNEIIEIGDSGFTFNSRIKPIEKENKQIKCRLIIKKEAKKDIRKKLEFIGISKSSLFADNIDIICENIVNQCKRIGY